jgi:predicted TIM-barrel fold metal-dependent hydrolase
VCPIAEQAALVHPDRFSYLLRVHRQDPDLESLIKLLRSAPAARALRVIPMMEGSLEPFSAGAYNALFAMAQEAGLPVFLFTAGRLEAMPQYFKNFPRLSFILDHCAMPWQPVNPGHIDEVLKLAAFPNVALKWAHEQDLFGVHTYPYEDLVPYLRRAIDAFGAERVMWAGDHSVIKDHSWGNLLFYILGTPRLSAREKEWILGRTLRRIINWPSA